MLDARLAVLAGSLPPGECKGKSGASNPEEVKGRKVAISTKVVDACFRGQTIWRNRDLATLPECASLKSFRGIGDFLGKGVGGLDLDRVYFKGDMQVDSSLKNALKAWKWLSENVSDRDGIAVRLGHVDAEAVDQYLFAELQPSAASLDSQHKRESKDEQAT